MKLTLGFSPCPNDTFIFDALIHHKIPTHGLDFEVVMEDVEALNQRAFANELHITKLSYAAFAQVMPHYALLRSGSALGNNCGPLLVAKQMLPFETISLGKIAIPGKWTTANFLLNLAFPNLQHCTPYLFSDIEDAVLREEVLAGLIIHENRFTYQQKGLVKIMDLGEYWETTTGLPIPLGGIAISRAIPKEIQLLLEECLRESIKFAFANPQAVMPFVAEHAQTMSEEVMLQHIKLYVNDYTINLGERGEAAVSKLFEVAVQQGLLKKPQQDIFI